MTTTQQIICPECGLVCHAQVSTAWVTSTRIHKCEHCDYIILDSEWQPAPKPAANWWAYILVAVVCLLMILATVLKADEIDQMMHP